VATKPVARAVSYPWDGKLQALIGMLEDEWDSGFFDHQIALMSNELGAILTEDILASSDRTTTHCPEELSHPAGATVSHLRNPRTRSIVHVVTSPGLPARQVTLLLFEGWKTEESSLEDGRETSGALLEMEEASRSRVRS